MEYWTQDGDLFVDQNNASVLTIDLIPCANAHWH
jgi:hypothetical protein